ncbi:MAG: response regulator transcription factor [Candidatus Eisenbacteria bacterium]|uniref:Response regulator transcription factor n=1 Tax=Eiseniibacteriota bacterium TaxID=2212470 RepID=A0A849SU56_UNCEI|nr:response regulator transcription factor [Candidatus Eisenbacteria bacterium]
MIRVLIVDDERPSREGLRLRLERVEGFEVVAEASSGRAAIAAVLEFEPDLMFLDIRMPDLNGFEVLKGIPAARRPRVIFVTAFDRHALRAFEVHALDYLLKPIVPQRFEAALEHARSAHAQRLASRTLEELAVALRGGADGPSATRDAPAESRRAAALDRLMVRDGPRFRIVPVGAIQWLESCGNYVTIHTGGRELLHRITLSQLEEQLPAREFARIHRGAIVNVAEVAEIRRSPHGDGEIVLRDGTMLRMSRRYRDALL